MNRLVALISAAIISIFAFSSSAQERVVPTPLDRFPILPFEDMETELSPEELLPPEELFFVTCINDAAMAYSPDGSLYPLDVGRIDVGSTIYVADGHQVRLVDGLNRDIIVTGTWDVGTMVTQDDDVSYSEICQVCGGDDDDPCRLCSYAVNDNAQGIIVTVEGTVSLDMPDGTSVPAAELQFLFNGDVLTFTGRGAVQILDRNGVLRSVTETTPVTDNVIPDRPLPSEAQFICDALWDKLSHLGCEVVGNSTGHGCR